MDVLSVCHLTLRELNAIIVRRLSLVNLVCWFFIVFDLRFINWEFVLGMRFSSRRVLVVYRYEQRLMTEKQCWVLSIS